MPRVSAEMRESRCPPVAVRQALDLEGNATQAPTSPAGRAERAHLNVGGLQIRAEDPVNLSLTVLKEHLVFQKCLRRRDVWFLQNVKKY